MPVPAGKKSLSRWGTTEHQPMISRVVSRLAESAKGVAGDPGRAALLVEDRAHPLQPALLELIAGKPEGAAPEVERPVEGALAAQHGHSVV